MIDNSKNAKIAGDTINYEVPVPYNPEFDNDSRYYKKNKPHVSLNQVESNIPKRDYRFFQKIRQYEDEN